MTHTSRINTEDALPGDAAELPDSAPAVEADDRSDVAPSEDAENPHDAQHAVVRSRAIGSLENEYEFGQRRREKEQRCYLVHQRGADGGDRRRPGTAAGSADDILAELRLLAGSAGAVIVGEMLARSRRLDPSTFIGSGKAEELREAVARTDADIVIVDHDISPIQERNLELKLKCRVLGRTGLILDIFARRAATHEGKMQVELAQLTYLSTRLVRGWSHLERQKGGIGLRGPGETQLELDRRMLAVRVRSLNGKLDKVQSQRALRRRGRERADLPTLSLVGYTNAGKSSLFNRLTEAHVDVADQLFKTLDPVMRKAELPNFGSAVFSDTVGFIRQLPHDLVTAFHSTLEEVANATLLLHVVDDASDERDELIEHVNSVLTEIGAETVPVVMVYNKVDISEGEPGRVDSAQPAVRVSAHTGEGVDALRSLIADVLGARRVAWTLCGGVTLGRFRAQVYARMTVIGERAADDGQWQLSVLATEADQGWLRQQEVEFDDLKIIDAPEAQITDE